MVYFDIVTREEVSDLTASAKYQIRERGSYLARYIILEKYEEIVKTIVDDLGSEYPCISPKTLKFYFKEDFARKFSGLFCNRVYSVNFLGRNFKIKNADQNLIKEKIKKYTSPKEKQREMRRRWIAKGDNATKRAAVLKKWKSENKEHVREYNNKYTTERRKTDEGFRLRMNLRSRMRLALKGGVKKGSFYELVGCSIEDLKARIESLWTEGMSWENYGSIDGQNHLGWHIDHIKACSSFDLSDPEQQKICFHYTNLQPLWGIDNIKKKNK
jgi:hypothetical protein